MANPIRIRLPDCLDDVTKLLDTVSYISSYRLTSNDIVYLDLGRISFISPYGLLGLLMLSKQLCSTTGHKIHIFDKGGKNRILLPYLERMDFFTVGKDWVNHPSILDKPNYKLLRSSKTDKLLEIRKIGIEKSKGIYDVDRIVEEFRKRAASILDLLSEKMDVNNFIKVLSELCTNIYTHSESDGYIAIQRYEYIKRGFEVVKLAVMDYGIGIKNSLNKRYNFDFQYDVDYIIKSLEPNVSGAGDRGFGLFEVKNIVERSSGYLWINSGNAALLLDPHVKKPIKFVNIPFLQGTRIAIVLAFEKMDFSLDSDQEYRLYS